MKNQYNLIVTVAAVVLGGVLTLILYMTKPTVTNPTAPPAPATGPLAYPQANVVYSTSLPGGTGGGAAGGGGGGPRAGRLRRGGRGAGG